MMSHKVSNKHHTLSLVLALFKTLFSFSFLCHSTAWWWCMVMCTHNLCVHSTTPITLKSNTMVSLVQPATTKKEKVILIVFDGKMST